MAKAKKPPEIKIKKVKGRISVLKVTPYKGSQIYLRKIDEDIIEYLVAFRGEIYSSYIIVTPRKGRRKLTKGELVRAASVVFTGAVTTIETLLKMKEKKLKGGKPDG